MHWTPARLLQVRPAQLGTTKTRALACPYLDRLRDPESTQAYHNPTRTMSGGYDMTSVREFMGSGGG